LEDTGLGEDGARLADAATHIILAWRDSGAIVAQEGDGLARQFGYPKKSPRHIRGGCDQ
jgi:hypothetical protein